MGSAARPLRWAGPPPLLILATVAAFLLLPFISDAGSAAPEDGGPQASLVGTTTATDRPQRAPGHEPPTGTGRTPEDRRAKKPESKPRPVVIGVASFNAWAPQGTDGIRADARALAARDTVDVIGWQEANHSRPAFADLQERGWNTRHFSGGGGDLAISWRTDDFAFVSAGSRKVATGVPPTLGRYPFGNRMVGRVTLRHRDTGELLSVINTHLPQKIEDLDNPGHWLGTSNAARARFQLARITHEWRHAPGRWVVGTGDFNFDARSDARLRPHDGLRDALGAYAVPSYAVLGFDGITASHAPTGRYIDYVHAARGALGRDRMEFVGQRMITGLRSDHHALLARIRLRP